LIFITLLCFISVVVCDVQNVDNVDSVMGVDAVCTDAYSCDTCAEM
jgi:hypothetical protein